MKIWLIMKVQNRRERICVRSRRGDKLAEELQVPLLGRIPLKQPDWDKDQFAPSVYDRSHPIGEIYMGIAQKVIGKTAE